MRKDVNGAALIAGVRAKHPRFIDALIADASVTASYRAERSEFRGRADAFAQALRLMWVSDAFLAQACYRAKARMQALGVPVLPRLAHRLAMMTAQVCIGDPVMVHPGVYLAHGQVVIDGFVEIHRGVVIFPVGHDRAARRRLPGPDDRPRRAHRHRREGDRPGHGRAPHARIGANSVVVDDVAAGTTVVGSPARPSHASYGRSAHHPPQRHRRGPRPAVFLAVAYRGVGAGSRASCARGVSGGGAALPSRPILLALSVAAPELAAPAGRGRRARSTNRIEQARPRPRARAGREATQAQGRRPLTAAQRKARLRDLPQGAPGRGRGEARARARGRRSRPRRSRPKKRREAGEGPRRRSRRSASARNEEEEAAAAAIAAAAAAAKRKKEAAKKHALGHDRLVRGVAPGAPAVHRRRRSAVRHRLPAGPASPRPVAVEAPAHPRDHAREGSR